MSRAVLRALAALVITTPALAQKPPVPRPLGAVNRTAAETFGSLMSVRQLPDGRVLVNDVARRRVVLLDADLVRAAVVADTSTATGNAYAGRSGNLIPFRGDSTLFVDPSSLTMQVITPRGTLGRVLSVPRAGEARALVSVGGGVPGFDARGRLVYRAAAEARMAPASPKSKLEVPVFPDSAPVVRVDLATRRVDTVAHVRIPRLQIRVETDDEGKARSITPLVHPLPPTDDWAVTSDGRVAVVRGSDYHVDWYGADGTRTSSPKVAFDWQRLDDAGKVAYLDSTKAALEKSRAAFQALATPDATPDMADSARRVIDASPFAALFDVQIPIPDGAGPAAASPRPRPSGGALPPAPNGPPPLPLLAFVEPQELPDYKPPFAAGAVRADADGNLWVREIPTKPYPGPVYGVIDGSGRLVDRVLLPRGTAIAGFGRGGVVYLGMREGDAVKLMRASR